MVLRESPACAEYKPHISGTEYTYFKPEERTLTLEPRTACGFFLYEYKAYLDVYHKFPMTVYNALFKTITYQESEYMVTESDPYGSLPGAKCLYDECHNFFYITEGKQYFFFVNWSFEDPQTVEFEIYDPKGPLDEWDSAISLVTQMAVVVPSLLVFLY